MSKNLSLEFVQMWVRPFLAPVLVGMLSAYITGNIALARMEERLLAAEKRVDRIESKQASADTLLLDVHKSISELKGILMARRDR